MTYVVHIAYLSVPSPEKWFGKHIFRCLFWILESKISTFFENMDLKWAGRVQSSGQIGPPHPCDILSRGMFVLN